MWSDGFPRYNTPISEVFSAENKLKLQMEVEYKLAKVEEEIGMIPEGNAEQIREAAKYVTVERVQEIESEIHHDLMAMVRALAEKAGKAGEYIHVTATSMDVQDTVLAMQMVQARKQLIEHIVEVADQLARLADLYKDQPILGRTHGQFAVPTTVGFKFANFLYELTIATKAFADADIGRSKFSGAVGNYASSMRTDLEEKVLNELGLKPVEISTQVATRLIHSEYLFHTAQIASIFERIAKEIRHLQRSEINELLEPRSSKQVGSSAMPHKRNPHKSERINGLVRIIRSNVSIGLENIALEHERDLTNSSVERIVIPSNTVLLDYIALQLKRILSGLEVNIDGIERNIRKASVAKSEQILLLLIDKVGRQAGHELLRKHVGAENFRESVLSDKEIISQIDRTLLEEIFDSIEVGLAPEKVDQILTLYKEFKNSIALA